MEKFRKLSKQDEKDFRQWARDNYKTLDPIPGIWHPVIQDECVKINVEKSGGEVEKLLATFPQDFQDALKKGSENSFHKESCKSGRSEWSGSPNPQNPDNSWICDECGAVIPANEPV